MSAGLPAGDAQDPVRVGIVDDHDLIRGGLRNLLADEESIKVVGEAKNGRDALALCDRVRPDLVLMDIRMPEMDGLSATRAIKQQHPEIVVLMITMHENLDYLSEALKAGAAGYVLKNASRAELIDAVQRARSGESPLASELAARLLRRLVRDGGEEGEDLPPRKKVAERNQQELRQPFEPLTPRELEVLELLVAGLTNRQIAERLVLSAATVKVHVQHIIAKLGVSDRTQAAVLATKLGFFASG